tara:strand:- start:9206 stop:9901 length:696 start_codon:yes stop_codon:yes gene_type:complete
MANKQKSQDGSYKVLIKQNFYKDHIYEYITFLIVCLVFLSFLIYSLFYLYINKPKDQYFEGYRDGSILQDIPVNEKYYYSSEIKSWTAMVLMKTLRFDFLDYKINLQEQENRFSDKGFESFAIWFKQELLDNMVKSRFVLTSHLCGIVSTLSEGVNKNNIFEWNFSMPIVMTFQNSVTTEVLTAIVNVSVIRVSSIDSFSGVHINDMQFENVQRANTGEGNRVCPTSNNYS